jgi:hypothetical protein
MTLMIASLGLIILTTPLFSIAAPQEYQITAKLFVDGKLVSSPRISTLSGEQSEVTQSSDDNQNQIALGVTAFDYQFPDNRAQDGILMDIDFEYKAGAKTIKTSKQVIAEPGAETVFPLGSDDSVQLKVQAVRL